MNFPTSRRQRWRLNIKQCARFFLFSSILLYASTLIVIFHRHSQEVPSQIGTRHLDHYLGSQPAHDDKSVARFIAKKWNLTSPHAANLLARQFSRNPDYDPSQDFLHFHHIAKTGGTSISDILEAVFKDTVMPGSARSDTFNEKEFHTAVLERAKNQMGAIKAFPEFKVSYAHTRLRPIHGPNKTKLSTFFDNYNSLLQKPKRIRSLAMIREPTDLRASAHAMAMCALNGKVNTFNYWREKRNQTRVCTKEEGLDVQKLVTDYHEKVLRTKCNNTAVEKLDKFEKKICTKGPSSMSYCLSPSHLLSSPMYDGMRSIYKSLLGRYFSKQPIMTNYISIERFMSRMIGEFRLEMIEEYTLIDLGGLDLVPWNEYNIDKSLANTSNIDKITATNEPDIIWFGITERMAESTCLLFHTLNTKPVIVPRSRVVNCPPTSWWTLKDREEVKRRELGDYAVWRVANAILDVRVQKMQREIRERLKVNTLNTKERERLDAFVEIGCLDFKY